MVHIAPAPLTRIGFRRDVKLFLMALVGFLIVLIIALLLLLQNFLLAAEDVVHRQWETIATAADESIRTIPTDQPTNDVEVRLSAIRRGLGITAIWIERPFGTIKSGQSLLTCEAVQHQGGFGTTTYWFDASELQAMNRTFYRSAIICVAATIAGMILLILYMPKILRPIEEMLDHAKELGDGQVGNDEARYLIDTFKSSIATLKSQEAELKRLHEAEKNRADELQLVTATLTRSLTSGFIAMNPKGQVVDINGAARDILGLDRDQAPDRTAPADLLGDTAFAGALIEAFDERRTLNRVEVTLARGDDAVVVGLATVPLFSEEQQFLGMLALFTDLTPIRDLEARVRDLQTLADLGEIAGGIAHEFRNSLTTILGYLRLARRATPEDSIAKLEKAEVEASLLASAVERLLTFARPMRLEERPVGLLELSRDVVARISDSTNRQVEFVVGGSEAEIEGDRALLSRAIENLVRNAADSVTQANRPGSVSITVAGLPHPTLRITDDGVGVDNAKTARLFLPFQSDKPGGFGLGLPLAKKIVLLHGGTIRLQGEPGAGAIVTVEFPARP